MLYSQDNGVAAQPSYVTRAQKIDYKMIPFPID